MNVVNQQRLNSENFTQFRNNSSILSGVNGGTLGGSNTVPPPLPPRVSHQSRNYQPYGMGYGGMQGGYGYGNTWNYNGYSPYRGYGGYSQMYPSTFQNSGYGGQLGGPSGDAENRFIQYAEESSRPAFQSIESIVRTFSSVAMMMESTHFAITNSFQAILGVAENIGKTRNMFGEVMSAFALVRFFKWLYRKITYMLGLNPDDPKSEEVWRKTAADVINGDERRISNWPIFLFLSLLVAIPYIINKLMNNVQQARSNGIEDPRHWFRYNEPVYSAMVLYDFESVNRDELSVKSGEKVWLAPQTLQPKDSPGWSRASDNHGGVGLIPTNYVKIIGQLEKKSQSNYKANGSSSFSPPPSQILHSPDSSSPTTSESTESSKESNEKLLDESEHI